MRYNEKHNMRLGDKNINKFFVGALNMGKGIYDGGFRIFYDYYRQVALNIYKLSEKDAEEYFNMPYSDVLIKETRNLTKAYLDGLRVTLKVDGSITNKEYPSGNRYI